LLAMLLPAAALWFAWRLSEDYLDIEKRVVGMILLTLIPFFNFHALKFNVNTVLMPLWAATTFWFLRSYQSRSHFYAVLAGVGAAGCMLGKYWSVFLLAGLFVAALIDARRTEYFRSAAPWITVAAGLIVLGPHVAWLFQNDFAPFGYAMAVHGDKPFINAVRSVASYFAGSLAYAALPVVIVLATARPSLAGLADMIWPAGKDRRKNRHLAAAAFWAPLLLPGLGAMASGTEITSLWSMPAWTLLPVLLLSPSQVTIESIGTQRMLIGALAVPLVMLVAAPAIAIIVQYKGPAPASAHALLLADQIERAWRAVTPQPLRFVGGDADIAYGIAAYAVDKPRALPGLRAPGTAELSASGQVLVCFAEDVGCVHEAERRAPEAQRVESEIARYYLRIPGSPQRYTILIAPPRG